MYLFQVNRLISKSGSGACIQLLYHQIVDNESNILDKGPVVHHRFKDFEQEIRFLKQNYKIIGMDEFADTINGIRSKFRPSVVITFDDGYLDNYTLAFPTLMKYQVPAIIYVVTELIGTNGMTWPDKIEYALQRTQKSTFTLSCLWGEEQLFIGNKAQKEIINVRIAQALKQVSDTERKLMLDELCLTLEVDPSSASVRKMLNWDEIREMADHGIEFGAHSHTHPILSQVSLEEAKQDILLSKTILEKQLGKPVRHFAYPNGRVEDFSEDLRIYCSEIGFETVSTVLYGINNSGTTDLYAIKRIGARSPVWMMAGEMIRLLLRNDVPHNHNGIAVC